MFLWRKFLQYISFSQVSKNFFQILKINLRANTNIDGPRNRFLPENNPSNKLSNSSDQRIFERIEQPSSGEFATFDHPLGFLNLFLKLFFYIFLFFYNSFLFLFLWFLY